MDWSFKPPKKARIADTDKIVEALNNAVTAGQREAALRAINSECNHLIEYYHDNEISKGIANALCLQLGYVLHRDTGDSGRLIIRQICYAFSLVYRCSDTVREISFRLIGAELIPLLLKCVEQFIEDGAMHEYDETVQHVLTVMHYFSRINSAAVELARYEGLLSVLVVVTMGRVEENARREAVATLSNLSNYAEEYRLSMTRHPGLLSSLAQVCYCCSISKAREHAVTTMRNLSRATNTKLLIAEYGIVIDALVKLTREPNHKIRRSAISTLMSLASAIENCGLLISHCGGAVLDCLVRSITSDVDSVVRQRAARTLRCLGRGDKTEVISTTFVLADKLSSVAIGDVITDVRIEAAQAIVTWADEMVAPMPGYDKTLNALVTVSLSDTVPCVELALKCLMTHSEIVENQLFMASYPGVLQTFVTSLCKETSSLEAKGNAARAVRNLSKPEKNREIMACNYMIAAFVRVLSQQTIVTISCQENITEAISNLASISTNRKRMARHDGLVASLVSYSATLPDSLHKSAVKDTILLLIPAM